MSRLRDRLDHALWTMELHARTKHQTAADAFHDAFYRAPGGSAELRRINRAIWFWGRVAQVCVRVRGWLWL